MNNQNSAVRSRQELKKLLKSGAITSEEYEAYQKRIAYGIAIPIEPNSAASAPKKAPASFFSVRPIETKIVYPSQAATPKPLVTPLPMAEQNSYKEKLLPGVKPTRGINWPSVSLAVLGFLLLLNLLVYQFLNEPNTERVASKSKPKTEKIIPADLPRSSGPVSSAKTTPERSDRIPMANTNEATVTQKATVARPKPKLINTTNSTISKASATKLLTDENEVIDKTYERLNAYYTDMQAAPFEAGKYFAPRVERYYTLANTTPAIITKNVNTYHFPEFLKGQSTIQEGSMKVVDINNNGYELTYLEHGSAFRKSKNKKQEVKAIVRIRFNPDFKITYFRQERLLQNQFMKE